ncbi:nitroreductase family protein [Paenibacillus eucommiae]|uniref:Oxidoreductase (Fatty acid repression mutant protein) n=1 Tax=Paenibacillus eucommiae TaxID=1355755 RepID=A0ABS4IQU8_9BACL|nr:nitroreductase family protein [Paenibacillus eucommiae]MBP1989948.1 putative oxidoreductase (fatty acid repression mutant protein) [Paenibacillus eucommiae]
MSKDFITATKERRSIYGISKEFVASDERIEEIVGDAVLHTPSSFNSQSGRVVVLLNEQHDKLWDITKETLRQIVPAENFAPTEEKMAAFRSGYGTVLFFEDQAVIQGLQEQFALYQDRFPVWSEHSSGMLQFVVWTALELEGYGASLQHYNPLIDQQISSEWDLPTTWKLIAQMPFGKPTALPGEKQFAPLEDRLKVIK